jgi:Tol biopolymer transport system component
LSPHGAFDRFGAWSPNGQRIVFFAGGRGRPIYIASMNAGGGDRTRLRRVFLPGGPVGIAWSPAGDEIAFSNGRGIWVVRPDGSGLRRIVDPGPGDAAAPTWSPDGARLAFAGKFAENAEDDVWTVGPTGTGLVRVTRTPTIGETGPDWAPRGGRISFTFFRDAGSAAGYRVGTVGADGSSWTDLGLNGFVDPVWSPYGRELGLTEPQHAVVRVRADGSDPRVVARGDLFLSDWRSGRQASAVPSRELCP